MTARSGPAATPPILSGRMIRQRINRHPALHAFVDGDVGQSDPLGGHYIEDTPVRKCLIGLFGLVTVLGCGESPQAERRIEPASSEAEAPQTGNGLSDRDLEIVEFILRDKDRIRASSSTRTLFRESREAQATNETVEDDPPSQERVYFLTSTPKAEWGDNGAWTTLPVSFHDGIADLSIRYRPASGAHLIDGSVYDKETGGKAWMQWITIRRWISHTEVEVEVGVWCCPLGGGASTNRYEQIDGEWRFKENVSGWVS